MSQKALFITEPKGALQLSTPPKPTAGKGELLVKNVAVALNPVEWKQIAYNFWIPSYPYVLGVDHAGIVEEVGEEVTNFKKGDRVCLRTFRKSDRLLTYFCRSLLIHFLELIKNLVLIKVYFWQFF